MNKYLLTILTFFLILDGGSRHFFTSGLNEENQVRGIEYKITKEQTIGYTHYYNSFEDYSNTYSVGLRYYQNEAVTILWRFGFVTGYGDQTYPFIIPGIDFKYEDMYFEVSVLPNVAIFLIKWEF